MLTERGAHKWNEHVTDAHYIQREMQYCVIPFLKYIPFLLIFHLSF